MKCAGCSRQVEIGDRYIEDTPSGFMHTAADPVVDALVADILGGDATLSGGAGGKVIYCEECTQPGGDYLFSTYYGVEDEDEG